MKNSLQWPSNTTKVKISLHIVKYKHHGFHGFPSKILVHVLWFYFRISMNLAMNTKSSKESNSFDLSIQLIHKNEKLKKWYNILKLVLIGFEQVFTLEITYKQLILGIFYTRRQMVHIVRNWVSTTSSYSYHKFDGAHIV